LAEGGSNPGGGASTGGATQPGGAAGAGSGGAGGATQSGGAVGAGSGGAGGATQSGGAAGAGNGGAGDATQSGGNGGMGGAMQSSGSGGAGGATSPGGSGGMGGATQSGGMDGAPPCTPNGKARNPFVTQIFTADPNAIVYDDRIYVYASHDEDSQTGYDMIDYHVFSSDDMANWRDHGVIIHSNSLSWASKLYAPGACSKNGKYYLYMPNQGSAIGVAVSDDPGGPFIDARGTALITGQTPNVGDVEWIFDPTCFVDDDGQAYLYFGGGLSGTGDNGRVIRLNDDMISLMDASATTIVIPDFFEAMYMHKYEGTYFLQYSAVPGAGTGIEYMTGTDPMTGFQHQGVILPSGAINSNNNNHASIVEYRGKHYMFYHNRKLQQELGRNNVYNRSIAVQEITYGSNETLNPIVMSTEDATVDQIKCMNGFDEVQAETLAAQEGIEVDGNAGEIVHIAQISDGDWIGYSQVDFREGATKLVLRVASGSGGGTIDVRIDGCDGFTSEPGSSIGTCQVAGTGTPDDYAELSCDLTRTSGPHDLCLSFSGTPDFTIDSWHLE
jgi:arabinoxylan arabinofuranohydrolase